ncbi:MAG: acyltransferase [Methylibium sp.]|nr:acyltransferase [Methylibium sp.]
MNAVQRLLARCWQRLAAPRMIYGQRSADGVLRAHSRVSTHARIEAPARLLLGDHVFIGHFNFIDASGGLEIEEGCQITNFVSVLTHSSHLSVRLERERYWGHAEPAGLQREPSRLGAWSFIGPHSVIAPGTSLGRGVLVRAYSFVSGEVPDFAVLEGQPARVVGDTRELDRAWIEHHAETFGPEARAAYEAWAREVVPSATPPPAPP